MLLDISLRNSSKGIWGGTYHVNRPVDTDHKISPRTIFMVLVLLYIRCFARTIKKRMLTVA